MIRLIEHEEMKQVYELIVRSFQTTVEELNITQETAKGYTAFLTYEQFIKKFMKIQLYGYFNPDLQGCIGLVRKSDVTAKIKWLAVDSAYRHQGIGKKLMAYLEACHTGKMTLGMIYENKKLLRWYETLGYDVKKIKYFKGHHFQMAYMEKKIEKNL